MPPTAAAANFPGPDALGRGVVVAPGAPTPRGFEAAPRVVLDDAVLADPGPLAAVLHHRWLRRLRTVVELAVDNDAAREPEICPLPPYRVPDDHTFHRERLHFLTWANSYDLRGEGPRWWHGVLAERRGGAEAVTGPDGPGDVRLPGGRAVWVDGGPRGPLAASLPTSEDLPLVHRESVALGKLTVQGADAPADALAPDQLDAVTHRAGPARVIAPAGSGKTRVLTARLRHLLRDRRVEPELVTAVAYNTRAAAELRARTQGLGASIRTLHSLALWICNLDVRRDVIQERDVRAVLDRLVRTARIPNQDPYQPYLEALAEVRLGLRDPVEVEAARGDVDGFAEMFEPYRAELARRGVLDFDEQVYRAIELLLTRPDIRRQAQQVGTHLLVDEFQDLTPAFLLLVRLVAGPSMQVFAVGDDDQTIYSYAGATPRYLVDVERWFPGASPHALEVNYRCPPAVVDAAVHLLSHNRTRVDKVIRAGQADDRPEVTSATTSGPGDAAGDATGDATGHATGDATGEAASAVAVHALAAGGTSERVVALIGDRLAAGAAPSDLAVLARVNSALLPVQIALTEAGIAHTAPLDQAALGRTGIRTALAYLRMGLDLDRIRREDVLDTINRPARKVKSAVQPLLRGAQLSIRQLEQVADALDGTHQERFAGYLGDLRHLERTITDGADTARCLWLIRNRIGLGEAMDALDASRTRPEGSSHGDDLDALEQLATLQPDPAEFRPWLADRLRAPADPDGVVLSTVHRVKGMEWDHVVVFAANQGLFPHRLADDEEEERRVFHVAITRCRARVDVVADRERVSPFVAELRRSAAPRPRAADAAAPASAGSTEPAAVTRGPDGTVVAVPGLEVVLTGGVRGRLVEVTRAGAAVRTDLELGMAADDAAAGVAAGDGAAGMAAGDGAPAMAAGGPEPVVVRVPFGSPVIVDGERLTLARAPRRQRAGGGVGASGRAAGGGRLALDGSQEPTEIDDALYEALRRWRSRIAAESGVPAYLVFHDRHLQVIAGRRPRSLHELAACPGVGPTKLERYGDDLLDLVEGTATD